MIITIGRQMGSGGREIGQALAKKLGIGYWDKELLYEAARRSGLAPELFEQRDEKCPSVLNSMISFAHGFGSYCFYGCGTAIADDGLYTAIGECLHEAAERESFVVVGRSADYVLRARNDVVSIFVHAPMPECIKRIMARSNQPLTEKEATAIAEKTNKLRAEYYNFYTDKCWGEASSYDLCIDSSLLPLDKTVELIATFVKMKLDNLTPDGNNQL